MSDIFEKYGDWKVGLKNNMWSVDYLITLNELKEALREELYPEFKERYDREKFEESWARKSGVTIDWLREKGYYGEPCDCDEKSCEGWKMNTKHQEIK